MLGSILREYIRLSRIAWYRARIERLGAKRDKLREKQMRHKEKLLANIREEGRSGVVLVPQGFEVER